MNDIISDIRKDLVRNVDARYKLSLLRFFKHELDLHGVPTPVVRRISARHYGRIKVLGKKAVLVLCEKFLKSGKIEERTIAFDWAWRLRKQFRPQDFGIFERWLNEYSRDWGGVDDLCSHALGYFLHAYPQHTRRTALWSRSPRWWMRRASAVSLIYGLRRGIFPDEAFKTAGALLTDKEDLVQKGYGWMLKVASQKRLQEVHDHVIKNKDRMPRTALRYAIEKMPIKMKKQAMERDN
jgi:3-methyladenine DNA glycosylase AlkD